MLALGESNIVLTPLELVCAYRKLALKKNKIVSDALEAAADYGTARMASPPGIKVAGMTLRAARCMDILRGWPV